MKKTLCLLTLIVFHAASIWAAERVEPQTLVTNVTQRTLQALRQHKAEIARDSSKLDEIINENILPNMDFVAMSKLVLGREWKKASTEQREAFVEQFKRLLVRTYAKSLREYSNESIEVLPFKPGDNPERLALVKSLVKRGAGSDIPIDYKLRFKSSDGWKVYDISIEGVSLVTNYNSSFARTINQNGLDALIVSLQEKNQVFKVESKE